MTPSDPTARAPRRDTAIACGIIFFAVALLFLLLGAAQGVRRGTSYLHIPETGSWLLAAALTGAVGALFLVLARGLNRD